MANSERTYIMVKPDGVQRGLVGEIIHRFERRGLKLVGLKMRMATEELLMQHYLHIVVKPFFPDILKTMLSGPVVCMIWEGLDAVNQGRAMLGSTNPLKSPPGTIRGDFGLVSGKNICHGSDSLTAAKTEIGLWMGEGDIQPYKLTSAVNVYE